MINYGLLLKNLRDSIFVFCICCIGLVAFSSLYVGAMQTMGKELLEFVSKFKILAKIFEMGFGINVDQGVSYQILFGVCFTHIVTLSLSWMIVISSSIRPMAGEIETGTADILFTLPITRTQILFNNLFVWIALSGLSSLCPVLGIWLATTFLGAKETIIVTDYLPVSANLFALNFAVGGMATLASSLNNKRSVAIAVVIAILVTSITLNFVEPFLPVLGPLKYVNLLYYFRPVDVIRSESWPWGPICLLSSTGGILCIIAMYCFQKRDIATG